MNRYLSALFVILVFFSSCDSEEKKIQPLSEIELVKVGLFGEPEMLNPINWRSAQAERIINKIFQSLLAIDFKTGNLCPVIAESRPTIKNYPDGKMDISFVIRKEAKWDDGRAITANDVKFTMKVLLNPYVNCAHRRPYYEFIKDVIVDSNNIKRVTFKCNNVYIRSEFQTGVDLFILPKHIYDPKNLLDKISITEISSLSKKKDALAKEFAEWFNDEKLSRNPKYIVGSGPYYLEEWLPNQRVKIKRKENWWGANIKDKTSPFDANVKKVSYQVVSDLNAVVVALKAGELDAMHGIRPKDFVDFDKSEHFNEKFNKYLAPHLGYLYLGINHRNPILKSKKIRQALAQLIDVDEIIKTTQYGMAERTIGFLLPTQKSIYNSDIIPYSYNPEIAKEYLKEEGWEDSNGNGILDKIIEGILMEFEIDFLTNAGHESRKTQGLMIQDKLAAAGIKLNLVFEENNVKMESQLKGQFDIYIGAWGVDIAPNDPEQLFHSSQIGNQGYNFMGYSNPIADKIMDSIKICIDESKRAQLYKDLQLILHEDLPYIYLYNSKVKIAINKSYENVYTSPLNPGFWEIGFLPKK